MQRILPWLALICAVAISVVAVLELDQRADDDRLALEPTALPSPSRGPTDFATPEGTDDETATPRATRRPTTEDIPLATERGAQAAPEPTQTTAPTEAPEPTPTPEPPQTPTPEPPGTPGAISASGERTPRTGGGAVPSGLALLVGATTLRALIELRRRSY